MDKPENYDYQEHHDVDIWLFQVQEHLDLTNIPEHGHVAYVASLHHGNATMLWRELCSINNQLNT